MQVQYELYYTAAAMVYKNPISRIVQDIITGFHRLVVSTQSCLVLTLTVTEDHLHTTLHPSLMKISSMAQSLAVKKLLLPH